MMTITLPCRLTVAGSVKEYEPSSHAMQIRFAKYSKFVKEDIYLKTTICKALSYLQQHKSGRSTQSQQQ